MSAYYVSRIRKEVMAKLSRGYKKFAIYPYGNIGMQTHNLLRDAFGINPLLILDNTLCKYNDEIKSSACIKDYKGCDIVFIIATERKEICKQLYKEVRAHFSENQIIVLEEETKRDEDYMILKPTTIGKHSYGPICRNHWCIKSIGAFCSFAEGVDAVPNHDTLITTSPFAMYSNPIEDVVQKEKRLGELIIESRFQEHPPLEINNWK